MRTPDEAAAGQRVALNLQGVEKQEIERGTLVGRPESLMLTSRIDATFRYLKLPFKAIKNGSILRFHIATTQVEARLDLTRPEKHRAGRRGIRAVHFHGTGSCAARGQIYSPGIL